jgi:hypothetical protein
MRSAEPDAHEYLLDTGVWRALSEGDVERLAEHSARFRVTSSAVVPFELISGIPPPGDPKLPSEFLKRRAALRRLLKAVPQGCLDLRTPHEIRSSAFGVSVDSMGLDFLVLMRVFTEAETPDEFYLLVSRACSLSKQMPTPNWLREQAERVSDTFRAAVDEGVATMRRTTEAFLVESGIADKGMRKLRRGYIPYLHRVGDLKRYAFLAVASVVGVSASPPDSGLWDWLVSEYERVRGMYNGSIDVYLDAYEKYIENAWNGEGAGRNDSFDLDHLVYMRPCDNSQVFVTEDQKLRDLATRSLPDRILDLAGFRRAIA